jgi:hypothetical protein
VTDLVEPISPADMNVQVFPERSNERLSYSSSAETVRPLTKSSNEMPASFFLKNSGKPADLQSRMSDLGLKVWFSYCATSTGQ